MKISVIIACRNARDTVEAALQSVLAQDYEDAEIIVVDGASTDGTRTIIEKYGDRLAHFTSEPDEGVFDAQNKGARMAAGDYLFFLNADDTFFESTVLSRVAAFLKEKPADFAYGDTHVVGAGQDFIKRFNRMDRLFLFYDCVNTQTIFYRASVFRESGLYDTRFRLAADYAWLLKAFFEDRRSAAYMGLTVANYSLGGMSASREHRRRFMAERREVQKRYYGPLERRLLDIPGVRSILPREAIRRAITGALGWNIS